MSQHSAHRHALFGLFGILQVGKFGINIWSNGLSLFELPSGSPLENNIREGTYKKRLKLKLKDKQTEEAHFKKPEVKP